MRVVLEVPVRFPVSSYFKDLTEDAVTDNGHRPRYWRYVIIGPCVILSCSYTTGHFYNVLQNITIYIAFHYNK